MVNPLDLTREDPGNLHGFERSSLPFCGDCIGFRLLTHVSQS